MDEQKVVVAIVAISQGMKQIADALADLAELIEEELPDADTTG